MSEVASGDPSVCDPALASEVRQADDLASLEVTDASGLVTCAFPEQLIGDSVADQSWFINLRATYRFVVSRVQRDASGRGHSTALIATPIRLTGGSTGALAANVGLGRFGAMPATLELPEGAVAYLADAGGAPLPETPISSPAPQDQELVALLRSPGSPLVTSAIPTVTQPVRGRAGTGRAAVSRRRPAGAALVLAPA